MNMPTRHRKIPDEIPATHAFARFLLHLPMDPACDPYPDILERGHSGRYFAGFMGDNSNARQTRFVDAVKGGGDTGAQVLTQRFGATSCQVVVWLTRFSPVIAPGAFSSDGFERINDDNDGSRWLALSAARSDVIPVAEDDNCTLMPTY